MCLGAYLGILCDTKYFGGTHRHIHNTTVGKGILRVLITALIFSPFLVIVNAKRFVSSYIATLFIVFVLPAFISGFVIYAFSRLIFERCKLVSSDVTSKSTDDQHHFNNLSDFSYDSEDDEPEHESGMKSVSQSSQLLCKEDRSGLSGLREQSDTDSMSSANSSCDFAGEE